MNPLKFNTKRYQKMSTSFQDNPRIKTMVKLTGENNTVLDLGCIDGSLGEILIKNNNTVYGIDASASAIPIAIEKGVKAKIGNLEEKLEFPDNMFDVVTAGEIIEHIFDIDLFLEEIHRVLKPKGRLVLTTPNLAALGRRILLLLNKNPLIEISFTGNAAGHIRYFIKQTLYEILKKHKFKITEFTSDVVNFNAAGSLKCETIAKLCPSAGRSLIINATAE